MLKELGWQVPEIVIIDKAGIGANWDGKHGFTNGLLPLDGSPEKDIGYPYKSIFGKAIDQKMQQFSWTAYLIDADHYVDWIDKGRLPPTHEEFANYLKWVALKSNLELIKAKVIKIDKNIKTWKVYYQNII